MTKNRDPLRGHVPLPAMGEQTETPKRLEGLLFAAINVAANEVPIVGSIFNEVRLYRANEVMQRRLATLVEEVKEQMKTVKETTVDWEFVRSEVFFDLVRQAVEVALRTRDRQKTEFVARVLRGAAVRGGRGGYSPEEYLGLISDLTPKELMVTLTLYKARPEKRDKPWRSWKDEACAALQIDESNLSITLSRVAPSGLIELVTLRRDESGIWGFTGEPGEASFYRVAPAFEKLMRFLFPTSRQLKT